MLTKLHLRNPRNPYLSSVPPIVQDWVKPDRSMLMVFRQKWRLIRTVVVVVMLIFALFDPADGVHTARNTIWAFLLYLLWRLAFNVLFRLKEMGTPSRQRMLSTVQFAVGIIAITAIVWAPHPRAADDSWLLYFIPLMIIGQSLERKWALGFVLLIVGFVTLSAFAPTAHRMIDFADWGSLYVAPREEWFGAVRDAVLRGLASAYVGFSAYIVIRSLAYQNHIVTTATRGVDEVTTTKSWDSAADSIANIIADLLSDKKRDVTANVIVHDNTNDSLTIVGSSNDRGQQLAAARFTYHGGITGWTAQHREPCYMNNTHDDPEVRFLPNAAFPTTRSALAAAFPIDAPRTVVLEVESPRPYDFANEDLQLLQIVGSHVLASHERTHMLDVQGALAQLGQDLAQRIIRDEPIADMLQHIGVVCRQLTHADIVSFYYRCCLHKPDLVRITLRGDEPPEISVLHELDPGDVSEQAMEQQKPQFFADAQGNAYLTMERERHRRENTKPFVVRENIVSCAVMPLVAAKESVGLMWVNFKHCELFAPPMQALIQLLVPYATLAVQAGRQALMEKEVQQETLRRVVHEEKEMQQEAVRRIVHDSLAHRLRDVSRSLDQLRRRRTHVESFNKELRISTAQVARALQVVESLINRQAGLTLHSLVEDLEKQAKVIEDLYGVTVCVRPCALPNTPIDVTSGNELMYACDEAIHNSLRHSQLSQLTIDVGCEHGSLIIAICDNGIGFDRSAVKQGLGLSSIEDRIHSLSGQTTIHSTPAAGTHIQFRIPLPAPA